MPEMESERPMNRHFSPYAMNGGTVLAIAGEDFSVVAGDTRLSEGFSIHSRDCSKLYQVNESAVVACTGFHGDVLTLTKLTQARHKIYNHTHNKDMSIGAVSAMLSTMLYSRRFFPYYVYNIVAGLDENGKGAVYSFDPVGSYERETYRAGGSASSMLISLLDNQVGKKNMPKADKTPLSKEKMIQLVKDVFVSAAERDIYTGDSVEIRVISKEGVQTEHFPLRRD